MPVLSLDHVNIRTPHPVATINFFRDVLGMRASAPMGGPVTDQGGWVLDEEDPAVLTSARRPRATPAMRGSGPCAAAARSIMSRCAAPVMKTTRQRLERLQVPFRANHLAQIDLHQIFVEEPTEITIELNFPRA